ncbi:MAG: PAS domain-containing protein [Rubrivivax sp.]|nr:PAS domain-containing protein [Rubrivivax sp.]
MADSPDAGGMAATAALSALAAAGPPLALVDAAGHVAWCSQAFADAVAGVAAAELTGTEAAAWVGEGSAVVRAGRRLVDDDAGGGRRLLRLLPDDDPIALHRTVADLQERMALLQAFCNAGVFERDPVTLQGRWDDQMYRIFGLPVPPPGTPAPPYGEISRMYLPEDTTPGGFRATLGQPGAHADRVRLRRPDGEVRHIHSQWKVFHDAKGRAVRVLGVNTDDTDVFQLARQAQTLREELDLVLRLSDIGLWRHDLGTGLMHLDERAARQAGVPYRPQGMPLAEARVNIHPDDRTALESWATETLRTGATADLAIRYRRPGGGWRYVLTRRTLQRDAEGRPLAFVGVLLDETERVERSRQALAIARRLESAAEAARIGLWTSPVDDSDRPDWNQRMFELFGLDPAQGPLRLGDWLRRCAHPEDRARVAELGARWLREGAGPIEIEFRAINLRDGSVRWLVTRGRISQASPDAPRRAEGVTIDITEQQEALQRLRESVERIELTAAAVGLGSWDYVVDTGSVIWDEAMFRLRGVNSPRRRVTREEVASFVHPQDRARVMDDQDRRLRGGKGWRTTFRVVWPDGTVRWLASRSTAIEDDAGRVQRRIGLNWDVTEAVLAEQAMRERELAVAESRAKSRFLSRISHELRTPLNAVLGFAQLLREEPAAADAAERRRWLGHIEEAGRHLLALIDDVLDLSRAESGDLRLDLQPVPLGELVAATLPLVERDARTRDVALIVDPAPAGSVQADPLRLRQVLLNLLSNAIKYNRPGGRVRVSSSRQGGWITLQVADTGRGIDALALRDAFEPFNRLGAEGLGIEGTGIGLAIAKALVEQMHGRIEVQSRAGEGSVFSVTLPLAGGEAAPAALSPAPPPSSAAPPAAVRPARVLYIEDNEVNALLVREVLAPHDWVTLETAADGRSGLQRVRDWQPDLVLLDMQLPDMDGIAVLQALRADPATAALRCVALSANAMPEDIAAARAAGAIDYWTKPIRLPEFLEQLAQLLRQA